ncbi:MAG: NAD(P)H-dependent oxidoreductase [Paracoccaceae bacterium]
MPRRIALIDGHPDPDPARLCHALADACAEGARAAGHAVDRLDVARMELPLLRTAEDYREGAPPPAAVEAQRAIEAADHVVLIYPLWLGTLPALTKGFLEQTLRPGFAADTTSGLPKGRLGGRSARVVVTMGMPALAYRWWFGAHSLRSLERNVLKFCGLSPVRDTLFGGVENASPARRAKWLETMRRLGAEAR